MTFPVPEEIFDKHSGILGMNGSGKTVVAKGAAERMLRKQQRFGAIDPTGAWWGLQSSKDGKKPGFDVVIFGGEHANLPISRNQGFAVADIVRTTNISFIIDTVLMTTGDRTRFITDFFAGLMLKKGPLNLFIDEAHNFAPQGKVQDPEAGKMLSATNRLMAEGRSRGLRVCLISQRPQKLHKDSLSEVRSLIIMQLTSPQNREAVESWIKENADREKAQEILKSLASLPQGTGWVWSPENDLLKRISFPMISTYDSSKSPDEINDHVLLSKPDLSLLNERLAIIEEETKQNDPALLRKKIAELEKAARSKTDDADIARRLAKAWSDGSEEGFACGLQSREPLVRTLKAVQEQLAQALAACPSNPAPRAPTAQTTAPPCPNPTPVHRQRASNNAAAPADRSLPPGESVILRALAQYPDGCTREQLTALTGYRRSTRDTYLQRLRTKEYVDVSGSSILVTEQGVTALGGSWEPLPSGQELRDHWLKRLPGGEGKILSALIDLYPNSVERDEISDLTGFKRSTRDTYIQRLKSKMLITIEGAQIKTSDTLFQ